MTGKELKDMEAAMTTTSRIYGRRRLFTTPEIYQRKSETEK
jgi:hypothetical protein